MLDWNHFNYRLIIVQSCTCTSGLSVLKCTIKIGFATYNCFQFALKSVRLFALTWNCSNVQSADTILTILFIISLAIGFEFIPFLLEFCRHHDFVKFNSQSFSADILKCKKPQAIFFLFS